jgi:mono/diheme cytochrome c family protein
MRIQMQFAAIVAMALLGACVGDIEPPDGDDSSSDGDPPITGDTARALFDSTVKPLLSKCAGCHVGPTVDATNKFLGNAGEGGYYTALTNDRAVTGGFIADSATMLSKGVHASGAAPAWLDDEKNKIIAWLNKEAQERNVVPPTEPPTGGNTNPRTVAMQFSSCMGVSQTEYTNTQAYQIANVNSDRGDCASCHNQGAGGSFFDRAQNYTVMFNKWQEEIPFYGVFLAVPQAGTPLTYKIGVNETKICNKGREQAQSLGTHPSFNCAGTAMTNALTRLKQFVDQVNVKAATPGACPTAAFKPSTI